MAKKDEILTKLGIIDEKVSATKKSVENLEKNNKEQWTVINNNKNRIVSLETKSEEKEKKTNHNFYIWGAIIGGFCAVIASLIIKFI